MGGAINRGLLMRFRLSADELRTLVEVYTALGRDEDAARLKAELDETDAILEAYQREFYDQILAEVREERAAAAGDGAAGGQGSKKKKKLTRKQQKRKAAQRCKVRARTGARAGAGGVRHLPQRPAGGGRRGRGRGGAVAVHAHLPR